jgi:hypothetical protein
MTDPYPPNCHFDRSKPIVLLPASVRRGGRLAEREISLRLAPSFVSVSLAVPYKVQQSHRRKVATARPQKSPFSCRQKGLKP